MTKAYDQLWEDLLDCPKTDPEYLPSNVQPVFVYGSLKQKFHNHRVLSTNGVSKLLGETFTLDNYIMTSLGGFPGVFEAPDWASSLAAPIQGELYEVNGPCLFSLDALEGNGHFYQREIIQTELGPAWMYLLLDPYGSEVALYDDNYYKWG